MRKEAIAAETALGRHEVAYTGTSSRISRALFRLGKRSSLGLARAELTQSLNLQFKTESFSCELPVFAAYVANQCDRRSDLFSAAREIRNSREAVALRSWIASIQRRLRESEDPNMRAMQIIEWGKPLEAREYPDPEPKGEEILLRVEAAGVCHSDVHIWDGYFDLGCERQISLESRGVHLPFTMGHEIAGEVAALGLCLGPTARAMGP
jgi:Alcohol dehydrogenase GroES-like domain